MRMEARIDRTRGTAARVEGRSLEALRSDGDGRFCWATSDGDGRITIPSKLGFLSAGREALKRSDGDGRWGWFFGGVAVTAREVLKRSDGDGRGSHLVRRGIGSRESAEEIGWGWKRRNTFFSESVGEVGSVERIG